jgi:hypothetical protein
MKKSGFTVFSVFLACFLVLGLMAGQAKATTITLDLDLEFSGGTPPNGATPWITATIDDSLGGPNGVRLTMSAINLVGNEFIDDWYFNLDPALDPTLLSFSYVGGQAANNINIGVNAFQADGDGKFDIQFDFPPPGQFTAKFTAGEQSIYDLMYIAPITASSFDFNSVEGGGNGTYTSAAHIQGIDPDASLSGWIGNGNGDNGGGGIQSVPEPGTLMLLAGGLMGLGYYGRKRTGI